VKKGKGGDVLVKKRDLLGGRDEGGEGGLFGIVSGGGGSNLELFQRKPNSHFVGGREGKKNSNLFPRMGKKRGVFWGKKRRTVKLCKKKKK